MVEEDHVTHYGSLMDPCASWFEKLVMQQYTEAYLYYSCMKTETDAHIRAVWERLLEMEISHLHAAAELLCKHEGKDPRSVVGGDGSFPEPLRLTSNIEYVRRVLDASVSMTGDRENYRCIDCLPDHSDFFRYQDRVNGVLAEVQSHVIIEEYIGKNGMDYRYETAPNPILPLRDRKNDNTSVGRVKGAYDGGCTLEIPRG